MAQSSISFMPTVSKLETLRAVSPITPSSFVQELASILPQNHLTVSKLPCSPSLLASTALPVMQDSTSSLPQIPFMSNTQELTSTSPQIPSTSMTKLTAPVSPLILLTDVSSFASASENTRTSSPVTTSATEFNDKLNLGDIADTPTGTSKDSDATPVDIASPVVVNPLYVYYKTVVCTDAMIE